MEEPKSRRKSKDAIDAVSDDKSCRKSVRGYASDDKSRKSERSERKERERRERKKKERRAQKLAQRFKELGLDENGNELDNFSLLKYPVRECKFRIFGSTEPLALNPVVTLIAVVCLWSIVVWCTVDPEGSLATIHSLRESIASSFGWLFLGSKAVFLFFLLYIWYRFGHLHLGRNAETDRPDFTLLQTAVMIFVAGAGPAFVIYSVSDTMYHRQSHFYGQAGYRSQDEIDQFAINMSLCAWSINTWLTFTIVAVATALAVHRFGLPLTFRSAFYPIFGAYTWGWIGDAIDGVAIVVMILGVCSMLCSSTIQIAIGLMKLGWIDEDSTDEQIVMVQKTIVWITTFISVASVISGLRGGIRYLALLAAGVAATSGLLVAVMDDTAYILNLQVQTLGYHLQTSIFQLNFWTDAFGQIEAGSGRAIDERAAEQWWTSSWTVFYQAYTVTLSCVFGLFAACICNGRKLGDLCLLCFLLPSGICLVWICTWAGAGFRQARQASELELLGETWFNNSAHFLADGSTLCYDVPQEEVTINETLVFTNHLPGVTPVCQFEEESDSLALLNVLSSFRFPNTFGSGKGLGPLLIFLYLVGCVVFYINLADAASFMVDNLASNGRKNNHWARRLFWASAAGTLATTLLSRGGNVALEAIEAGNVVTALPVAILLCFLTQSITLLCRQAAQPIEAQGGTGAAADYTFPDQPEFAMPVYGGIFNIVEYVASFGKVNQARIDSGMDRPTRFQIVEFFKGVVAPFASLSQVLNASYPQNARTNCVTVVVYAVCYIGWVSMCLASRVYPGLSGLATALFLVTGSMLGWIRSGFRAHYNLRSNSLADWMVGTFMWPQVMAQMRLQGEVPDATRNQKIDKAHDSRSHHEDDVDEESV